MKETQMKLRLLVVTLALACVLLVPLTVPASAQNPASEVRISIVSDQWGLTPYDYNTGYPGYIMMSLLYDNLLWFGPDGSLIPWLASDYTVSDDGLTWTFTLQPDAMWHDGEPVTAEDVAFTMEFIKDNQHLRWTDPVTTQVESVEVVDEHTAVIHLTAPTPGFALLIAADVPILPQHIWQNAALTWGEPVDMPPIGSGPYKIVEHQTDVMYRMEANPDYWGGAPLVDSVVFVIINDINAQMTALRSGEIDFATGYVPPELVDEMNSDASVAIARAPGYVLDYVGMHCDRAPLNDTTFRLALAYAVNVEEITSVLYSDYAVAGSPGYVPPSAPWATPIEQLFDPDKAMAMLDEAGYLDTDDDGWRETPDGEPIDLEMHTQTSSAIRMRAGELVAEFAAAVGIRIQPTPGDFNTWMTTVREHGDYDMYLGGWSAPVQQNPDRLAQLFRTGGALNFIDFTDPDLDTLLDTFKSELDSTKRLEQAAQIQEILAQTAPYIPLYYPDVLQGYRPEVYDGWMTIPGTGAFDKQSFLPR
jgi:peptide/nickel transport system substrate-binding protein